MNVALVLIVGVALAFDFFNGFHDAANSIATVVSTRVLTPRLAVAWAAFFNFVAFLVFGTQVASTGWGSLIGSGLQTIAVFIVLSPIVGFLLGFTIMVAVYWLFHRYRRVDNLNRAFRRMQLVSAAAFSLGHGANDAQKTMGVILALLIANGVVPATAGVPLWVVLAAHTAIGLGTLFGGWRIVHTMGSKITKLQPVQGMSAELAAAGTVFFTSHAGIPVSTTHTITGGIVGTGTTQRLSAVRWGIAGRVVWAWVLTIPGAFVVAWLAFQPIRAF